MGNSESQDVIPSREDHRKELNISRKVSHKQYQRHMQREYSEACLWDLPWSVRDSVAVYERFDASFNCLSDVPPELPLRLPHLSHLNLSCNQVEELPESLGLLFHLEVLLLSHNRLQALPASLTQLDKLEKLDISHNQLQELPADLGTMPALAKLNVCHNKTLRTLPSSLGRSQVLSVLIARHNRLEEPPQKVCNEGSAAILKYLREQSNLANGHDVGAGPVNVFPRVRGNQLPFSAPNPHSAMAEYIQTQTNTTNTPSRVKTPLLLPQDATTLNPQDLTDRILGLLYGAAIGDAVGIATENLHPDDCQFHYDAESFQYSNIIRDSHRTRWRQGDWTTHFDQVALILDSLIAWAGVVDELDFASRLADWSMHGFPELGDTEGCVLSNVLVKVVSTAGYATDPHHVSAHLLRTVPIEDVDQFADNAALPRAIIMGIPYFYNLTEVENNAVRICRASHSHPLVVASSVCLAVSVALFLQGRHDLSDPSAVENLIECAQERGLSHLDEPSHIEDFKRHLQMTSFDSVQVGERGRENHVLKPLACAMIALRMNRPWMTTVMELAMLGGQSTSHACAAGAFLGARDGYGRLPRHLVQDLRPKQSAWLAHKVNLFLDMMGLP